jgi:hypothetical protein
MSHFFFTLDTNVCCFMSKVSHRVITLLLDATMEVYNLCQETPFLPSVNQAL